jgi:hypothetical protein
MMMNKATWHFIYKHSVYKLFCLQL